MYVPNPAFPPIYPFQDTCTYVRMHVCVRMDVCLPTPLVLHPRKRKAALLDAELLGHAGDGRGGGVILLVEDEAQVLLLSCYCHYVCVSSSQVCGCQTGLCGLRGECSEQAQKSSLFNVIFNTHTHSNTDLGRGVLIPALPHSSSANATATALVTAPVSTCNVSVSIHPYVSDTMCNQTRKRTHPQPTNQPKCIPTPSPLVLLLPAAVADIPPPVPLPLPLAHTHQAHALLACSIRIKGQVIGT